jgi:hypothetical protein
MANVQVIALIAAVILAVVAIVFLAQRRAHTVHLEREFGPEYRRLVHELGSERAARHELEQRKKRVARLPIRDLDREDAERFRREWVQTQSQFVDDPNAAIARANVLVKEVMAARGYPMSDFEARAADLSVDHAKFIGSYRAAHEIAMKSADGSANTEELRGAMVHYRELFLDLLGDGAFRAAAEPTGSTIETRHRRLRHAT